MRMVLLILAVACACSGDQRSNEAAVAQTPSTSEGVVACGPGTSPVLTGNGLGSLSVGLTADSVKAACPVVKDTLLELDEGEEARTLFVAVAGDTVEAVVVNGQVWRVEVASQSLRTVDSLGVGSTLRELLRSAGTEGAEGAEGEGVLYVKLRSKCGISFRLDATIPDSAHRSTWTIDDLRGLDGAASVDRVLLVGCRTQ